MSPEGRPDVAYLGIGMSSNATAADVKALADAVVRTGRVGWDAVIAVATTAGLAGDARLGRLGPPVIGFEPAALAAVAGTRRSERALAETGTASVAEAAALLAAGPQGRLVVSKRRSARVTAALACP